ncbi:YdcF family protein [Ureibacillus sp. NPDC094379]
MSQLHKKDGRQSMKLKKIVSMLIIIIICLVAALYIIRGYLVVDETPKQADVIIVLSGDEGRLAKGAQLYKEGYADYVLLTRANEEFITKEEAINFGIPESQIILEEEATSTYTNATYAKSLLEKHQFNSSLVVSSDYHMRRTKLSFERVFKGLEMELTYVAAPVNGEVGEISFPTAIKEYIKLVGYTLGMYRFIDLED